MTIKPRTSKFRTRGQDGGSPKEPFTMPVEGGDTPDIVPRNPPKPDNTIENIRREGLTGRQLRMARRTAQRHNLPATSDYDAVRLLRANGIDPFERTNALQLVGQDLKGQALAKINPVKLPQAARDGALPSTDLDTEDAATRRAHEIQAMQRDIARRRRKRMALLNLRLAFFVFLPTIIAGYYFYNIATPMYATKSSFIIQQNDAPTSGEGGGLGGMLGGGGLGAITDSITVQEYLTSQEAMIRLNNDQGFKAHFSSDNIDPLTRLEPEATNADAYKLYQRHVKIGYDPTEGLINMEIIAATPEATVGFSQALIDYAEEQVSNQTQRLRDDQMRGARESYQDSEEARNVALERMVQLQANLEVGDPQSLLSSLQSQITGIETELNDFRLQLAQQLENRRPNRARVDSIRGEIRRREVRIAELQSEMTKTTNGELSAAEKQARLRVAEADFQTRDAMLQLALQNLESARVSADRQARFLANAVSPVLPDAPSYPRSFENTLLAFLIFGGGYLIMSLTASILREQV